MKKIVFSVITLGLMAVACKKAEIPTVETIIKSTVDTLVITKTDTVVISKTDTIVQKEVNSSVIQQGFVRGIVKGTSESDEITLDDSFDFQYISSFNDIGTLEKTDNKSADIYRVYLIRYSKNTKKDIGPSFSLGFYYNATTKVVSIEKYQNRVYAEFSILKNINGKPSIIRDGVLGSTPDQYELNITTFEPNSGKIVGTFKMTEQRTDDNDNPTTSLTIDCEFDVELERLYAK